jgi:hypothetical protein
MGERGRDWEKERKRKMTPRARYEEIGQHILEGITEGLTACMRGKIESFFSSRSFLNAQSIKLGVISFSCLLGVESEFK